MSPSRLDEDAWSFYEHQFGTFARNTYSYIGRDSSVTLCFPWWPSWSGRGHTVERGYCHKRVLWRIHMLHGVLACDLMYPHTPVGLPLSSATPPLGPITASSSISLYPFAWAVAESGSGNYDHDYFFPFQSVISQTGRTKLLLYDSSAAHELMDESLHATVGVERKTFFLGFFTWSAPYIIQLGILINVIACPNEQCHWLGIHNVNKKIKLHYKVPSPSYSTF